MAAHILPAKQKQRHQRNPEEDLIDHQLQRLALQIVLEPVKARGRQQLDHQIQIQNDEDGGEKQQHRHHRRAPNGEPLMDQLARRDWISSQ